MSIKFGKTKGTEGLIKLTKLGVSTLILGDILKPTVLEASNVNITINIIL